MPRRRPTVTALRHTGIVVTDLGRSLKFYQDILGFKPGKEAIEEGPFIDGVVGLRGARLHWIKLKAPDGGTIELLRYLSHPRRALRTVHSNSIGASHIAVTVADADDLCRGLRRNGYKVNAMPRLSPDGKVKVAYAHDPDGTIVEVVQEMA